MATLIVFVDALPFDDLGAMPRLASWPYRSRLRPGFGYSINLHAELFAGAPPDAVGFFGEWAFDPAHAPGHRYRRLLPLLDRIFAPYALNRGLQALLTARYRPERIMPNLPLGRLGDFAIHGAKLTDPEFPRPTLFTRHPRLQQVSAGPRRKGERDAAVVTEARRHIDAGANDLYVPLPDLDGTGHRHGTASHAWRSHLAWVDAAVDSLATRFLGRHPAGDAFVISDHGMADVTGGVTFDPTPTLGRQGRHRYLFFSDSTLLRVWVRDPRLEAPVAEEVAAVPGLTVITDAERQAYGLTNPDFGRIIAILDEGRCFEPSTFARHMPVAMHGYHPEVASQHAVLLHRGAHPPAPADRTIEVFSILDASLTRPS